MIVRGKIRWQSEMVLGSIGGIVTNWYYSVVGEVIGGREGLWGVIGVC